MRKLLSLWLLCFIVSNLFAQGRTLTGKVTDEKGNPIAGASVSVKGADNVGIAADEQGNFTLNIPSTARVLVISSVNYKTQEIKIDDRKVFEIKLQDGNTTDLGELVVTANAIKRDKKSL